MTPLSAFPEYTGSVTIPSVAANVWIASIV
jgi:hypothetical protein